MRMPRLNDAVSSVLLLFLIRCSAASTDDSTAQPEEAAVTPPPIFTIGEEFNPTMALIMVVLVSAFFSLGFFSVYIRQCVRRRIRGGAASTDTSVLFIGAPRPWRTAFGVGDEIIRSFPSFRYSAVKGVKVSLECAVCLNEFVDDEKLRLLPKCRHVFHSDCIDAWLSTNTTCPVCRANLVPKPGEDLNFTTVQIPDPDYSSGEPETNSILNVESVLRSPEVNAINQSRPRGADSTERLYLRSHSTGHSPAQVGGYWERVTLMLPEEVRRETLKRTRSLGALLPSERRGYRSGSVGTGSGNSDFRYVRFG